MPEVCKSIQRSQPSIKFVYLSASPYRLFPFFKSGHRLDNYPGGEKILPSFWESLGFLLRRTRVKDYKAQHMRRLAKQADGRVLCIGDACQFDPGVYTEFFEADDRLEGAILIRIVKPLDQLSVRRSDAANNERYSFQEYDNARALQTLIEAVFARSLVSARKQPRPRSCHLGFSISVMASLNPVDPLRIRCAVALPVVGPAGI